MTATSTTSPGATSVTQTAPATKQPEPVAPSAIGRAAMDGVRDITPMVVGVIPFGLAIGAAAAASSLSAAQALTSGAAILAGASQLTVITMLDDGVAPLVVILSALIVNARILLYSASLAPWFRSESLRMRLLLAIPVIDQMYFTCLPRFQRQDLDRLERRAYYLAAGAFLIVGFVAAEAVALTAGARLPGWTGIEVMAPLALAGLLAKSVVDRAALQAAGAAAGVVAVVAVAGLQLPFQSAILVAIGAGVAAGLLGRDGGGHTTDTGETDTPTTDDTTTNDNTPTNENEEVGS